VVGQLEQMPVIECMVVVSFIQCTHVVNVVVVVLVEPEEAYMSNELSSRDPSEMVIESKKVGERGAVKKTQCRMGAKKMLG